VRVGEQHEDEGNGGERPYRHLLGAAVKEAASPSGLGRALHSPWPRREILLAGAADQSSVVFITTFS
jgi:hypothetical protein